MEKQIPPTAGPTGSGRNAQADDAAGHLRPLESRTRDMDVLDALADMIAKAGLKVGDRLPSELVLAQRLAVGRSTIREALKSWQSLGVVTKRTGSGSYLAADVSPGSFHIPLTIKLEGESLLRTHQVRRALEVSVTREAACNATKAQRAEIRARYDHLMKVFHSGEHWYAADHAFHRAIYDASSNPLFGEVIQQVQSAFHRIYPEPFGTTAIGAASLALHGALCDAVCDGDAERAVEQINLILDETEKDVRRILSTGALGADRPK